MLLRQPTFLGWTHWRPRVALPLFSTALFVFYLPVCIFTISKSTLLALLFDSDAIEIFRATAKTEVQRQYSKYDCTLVSLAHKVYRERESWLFGLILSVFLWNFSPAHVSLYCSPHEHFHYFSLCFGNDPPSVSQCDINIHTEQLTEFRTYTIQWTSTPTTECRTTLKIMYFMVWMEFTFTVDPEIGMTSHSKCVNIIALYNKFSKQTFAICAPFETFI